MGLGRTRTEERAAVHHVDDLMGELEARLKATGLPVDLIVVADHGMVALQPPPVDLSSVCGSEGGEDGGVAAVCKG